MTIFYLDYENGDDSKDGSNWANAWKTINAGATAARIAPGDIIRIAKSPDPSSIGNAAWTNLSKTVTLATSQTATIDNCDNAWTASANVTATASATARKEGNAEASLAIAAAFTTGKVAYHQLSSPLDLSSYQKISFWIRNNLAITANYLKLVLCSDTTGDTIVDTFYIPAIPSTNRHLPLTLTKDGGGNLGASIQSIALYADSDPGAVTVLLDNIIACTTDGLNLQSLISKNSAAQGGAEGWYGIQSIVDTTVLLDNDTNTLANAGRGYSGATETVTTYKRETIKTALAASSSTYVNEIQDSGAGDSRISFQGGYNTSNNNQDGETFFDGLNGYGRPISATSKTYVELNYLNIVRYGFIYMQGSDFWKVGSLRANNNMSGISWGGYNLNADIIQANNNNGDVTLNASVRITTLISNCNIGNGVTFSDSQGIVKNLTAKNNSNYGVDFNTSYEHRIYNLITANNSGTAAIRFLNGLNYLFKASISEATKIMTSNYYNYARLFSQDHDDTPGNHWIFFDGSSGGTINAQTTERHTASGIAWKLSPNNRHFSNYPLFLSIAKVAVEANSLVTVKAWMKKDHASNVGAKLVCRGGQIAGVDSDVTATKADDTDWEELTITFTPTEAGVVDIEAWGYYIAGNSNIYVDDLTITQA